MATTSLVLPCYNPQQGWEQNVCTTYKTFSSRVREQVELVIVIDGPSETVTHNALSYLEQNIADLHLVRYEKNRGKGYALRQGIAKSTGDIVIYTDIDFPYTMDSMYAIYEGLKNNEFDV